MNVAKDQPTEQSSTKRNFTSSKAVDGDFVHDLPNGKSSGDNTRSCPSIRLGGDIENKPYTSMI